MLLEIAIGFGLTSGCEFLHGLGLAVGETMGVSPRFVLPALGFLARRSQIDRFSHVEFSTVTR